MPVNAGIYANVGAGVPALEDPQNALMKALQVQQARLQGQQARQGMEDDQALREATMASGGDQNKLMQLLYGRGQFKAAAGVQKSMLDADKLRADAGKTNQDIDSAKLKDSITKLERGASILSTAKDPQSYAVALQTLEANFPGSTAKLPPQFDPQAVEAQLAAGQSIKDRLAAQLGRDTLGQTIVRDTDTNLRGIESNKTQLRGQDMTAQTAKAGQDVTMRGQNMVDSRSREGLGLQRERMNLDSGAAIAEAGGPSQAAFTKQFGKAEPGTRWKADGTLEPIPGGSKDPKGGAKATDAQDVLSLLEQAGPLVERATGSYAGVGLDQAARVVGQSTEGSRAAAQLRVLEGALISKMPKMSGPQSDKDVLLYKQMAGQIGDPTIPRDQKIAAMQTIREINERHAGATPKPARTVVRTGKSGGRKVVEYSDGTIAYAD